jgi:uncharacterized membrane protein
MSRWKRDVASGLVVVVPIFVSVYVVAWIYWQLTKVPILKTYPDSWRVAAFLSVFALVVLAAGYLMRTTVGRVVEALIDDAANRVPLVRVVYNASKMAAETALKGTEELQTPVKIEPWNGMRLTAFKTGKTTEDGRDVLFMPTAPNITSGFVVEVHPDDYEETDERVEDALTRILSAGFGESREGRGVPIDVTEETPVATGTAPATEETPAGTEGDADAS